MTFDFIPYEHPGILIPRMFEAGGPYINILDVGGGGGTVGAGRWGSAFIQVIDIFPPNHTPPNFLLLDGLQAAEHFGEKSFDVVLACETIEHLEKEDGAKLLQVLERVARKWVIVTTPQGFQEQDPAKYPNEPWANNPHQKHLCGWEPQELADLGYTILLNGGPVAAQVLAYKDMRNASL